MPRPLAKSTFIKYEQIKFRDGTVGNWEAVIVGKRVLNDRIFNFNQNNCRRSNEL